MAEKDLKPPAAKPEQIRTTSHGRGGAGNINSKPNNTVAAADLKTPTIKTNTYTTGRGGQGNMATNLSTHPEYARAAQDVEAPAHHEKEARGTYHWGRGGEGNMMTLGSSGAADAKRNACKERAERNASKERAQRGSKGAQDREKRRGSFQGMMEKGKEMLGLRKGEKGGESAVEEEK